MNTTGTMTMEKSVQFAPEPQMQVADGAPPPPSSPSSTTTEAGDDKKKKKERKPNPWLVHVKQFRLTHPEMKYKQVLVEAKATYQKKNMVSE